MVPVFGRVFCVPRKGYYIVYLLVKINMKFMIVRTHLTSISVQFESLEEATFSSLNKIFIYKIDTLNCFKNVSSSNNIVFIK